ncbi:MAG TPA: recombinase family protein [Flavipsychrobacter sp.]
MNKKVILYLRVSTEEQTKGLSIRQQEAELMRHCQDKGWIVIDVIYEKGQSAKSFKRRSWAEFELGLNKRISQNKPDILLVTKIDRFSRNAGETRRMVDLLKSKNIQLYTSMEGLYDFQDPSLYYSNTINSASAEYENLIKARNVTSAMRQGLEEGRWMWRAPIGYKNDVVTKLIVPNEKGHIVAKCFEKMATGLFSADQVRREAVNEGLKVAKSTFYNILKNPLYAGVITRHAYTESGREIPEKRVKGIHAPLISESTFYKVQQILEGKKKPYKGNTRREELFLRGFLFCPKCGNKMTGSASTGNGGRYHYYHCQRKYGCSYSIHAESTNVLFYQYLKQFTPRKEILFLYQLTLESLFKIQFEDSEAQKRKLEKEIEDIKQKQRDYTEKFFASNGYVKEKDYKMVMDRLNEEEANLVMSHATISLIPSEYEKYLSFGLNLLGNLSQYFQAVDVHTKQRIIGSIFPEKLVFENNKYRTTKLNQFFALYCNTSNALKRKQVSDNANLSEMAPPSGLEPETP